MQKTTADINASTWFYKNIYLYRGMDKKIERIINFLYDKTGHDTLIVVETLPEATKSILDIIDELGGFLFTVKLQIGIDTYLYNANEAHIKKIHVLSSQDDYAPEQMDPCDLIIGWKYSLDADSDSKCWLDEFTGRPKQVKLTTEDERTCIVTIGGLHTAKSTTPQPRWRPLYYHETVYRISKDHILRSILPYSSMNPK